MPTDIEPVNASTTETVRIAAEVVLPTLASGVIKRRPAVLAVAERLRLGRSGVGLMRRLRSRHDARPLRLRVPGRSIDLVLSHEHVGEVLAATPVPFSPSTFEKRAALSHFQPHGVLISDVDERRPRRRFNEEVLEPQRSLHELAAPLARAVADEAALLARESELSWHTFTIAWWQLVRRLVLGEGARYDDTVTDLLARLRLDANWAYAHRRRDRLHARFHNRLTTHLDRAEPGSLAAVVAATDQAGIDPADQVAHWLFAFDAAGMVTFRALGLLANHPDQQRRAREEIADLDPAEPHQLPYLRACVLESVRLWPTTPVLLRESTTATAWGPAGTTVLIFTPFFHRDPGVLPYADRFEPDIWLDGRAEANPALVPFSGGPAVCPGRNIVLFCASTLLAALLHAHDYRQVGGLRLDPDRPLPATLDPFRLRFTGTVG
ncbi:cytochrome P450 [Allokutzneria oryzae]|uniref:Cytochrome P450 n=1 Tax=Allokutzneria oryzae TaxID=1378989 RepID=A0ABV6A7D9_9PSEU